MRILVMVGVVLFVVRNQLTRGSVFGDEVSLHETDQAVRVRVLFVLKVEAIVHLSDIESPFVRLMLEDELLQIEKGPLVVHTLSYLDLGDPSMWGVCHLAVITLLVVNDEFNLESLLQHRVMLDFFLHSQLHFDTSRVGLCPDKGRVEELDQFETLDVP